MDILIQILMAFAGSLGFALMLNVKKGHVFFAIKINGITKHTNIIKLYIIAFFLLLFVFKIIFSVIFQ